MEPDIAIPQSFLDSPRWWTDGSRWLTDLPRIAREQCGRWGLTVTGRPSHGSNALVLPVHRGRAPFVLRLTPPGPDVAALIAALRFWDGRGTVHLIDADAGAGAMLLERLDADGSLLTVPSREAMVVLGVTLRRLAVPAPVDAPRTTDVVTARLAELEADWHRLGRPFDETFLRQALVAGDPLRVSDPALAVDADLHSAQVLRGSREPWLTVDPVLMRGDPAYDLGRVLWTRADDMPDAASIIAHFDTAVAAAGIDRDHGRNWVLYRSVDYWLWGLAAGLTEDPERCRRLVSAFAG